MRQGPVNNVQPWSTTVTGTRVVCLAGLFAVCLFMCSCDEPPRQPGVEEPPAVQPAPAAEPVHLPKLSPPKLLEVQEAVKRVFKDAAVIDSSLSPNFMAGDFNGDLSQDIVVVLRVAPGKLAEMNEEFPAWILRDALAPYNPAMPFRVEDNDVLLAVIHGYGTNDWRDPQATQTHLLKNAVGSRMEVHAGKEVPAAKSGKRLPRFKGDLIGQILRGSAGYIYYSGESYTWYDPKTFKGEPERAFTHGRRVRG